MIFRLQSAFPDGTSPVDSSSFAVAPVKKLVAPVVLSLTTVVLLCGCHKKSDAKSTPPETVSLPTTANAPAAPAPRGPMPQPLPAGSPTIAADASTEVVTAQLTRELRRYVAYTRTIPKNFEDFAAHDPVKFPPPPAGKKYVITGGKVVLQ
jgi:hypothetical protein